MRSSLTSMRDVQSLAGAVALNTGKFVIPVEAGPSALELWTHIATLTAAGKLGLLATINTQLCLAVLATLTCDWLVPGSSLFLT